MKTAEQELRDSIYAMNRALSLIEGTWDQIRLATIRDEAFELGKRKFDWKD